MFADFSLLYMDSRTIQIVGSKTKDDSVQDLWSEKKKKHRQPSATTKHPIRQQELIESGITAEAASANAQKVDATLKEKSSQLRQLNRLVAKQARQQQLLANKLRDTLASLKNTAVSEDAHNGSTFVDDPLDGMGTDGGTSKLTAADSLQNLYRDFDDQRQLVQQTRASIFPLNTEVKDLKEEKYALNKFSKDRKGAPTSTSSRAKGKQRSDKKAATRSTTSTKSDTSITKGPSAESSYTSTPTVNRPGTMDYVEATCIRQLKREIEDNNATNSRKITLVPGGTDPGAKVLFETVIVPERTLIKLQNRYHLLSGKLLDSDEATADQAEFDKALAGSREEALAQIKIPKTQKTTVGNIRHISGLTRQAKQRKTAVKGSKDIAAIYDELGEQSAHRANTTDDLKIAAGVRRKSWDKVRAFELSNARKNTSHNVEHRLQRAYDYFASRERREFKRVGQVEEPILEKVPIQSNGFCPSCKTHHRPELIKDPHGKGAPGA
ncbi:hypothetical protein EMPS_08825 [Entomortierella parvispora]|uniref:Uncharacterized protein n=1 Tax=Entomortierella parvispora TaxID=205924 RepID=A0A9P3LZG6_9FUNG|nr:hypothetical protein EMPS_08825 [Entomortierella parvispora]